MNFKFGIEHFLICAYFMLKALFFSLYCFNSLGTEFSMYYIAPCSGGRCIIMVPRRPYPKPTGPMDQWLESQGYYRKHTARDGSCLFRAVAEQVFKENLLKSTLETIVHSNSQQNTLHFIVFYKYIIYL